jgi:hypothetical protein
MRAPPANAEMQFSQSPETRAEQIDGPAAPVRAMRRADTETIVRTERPVVTEKRDAEARSLELSLKSLGDELGRTLAERTAAELRVEQLADALVTLQATLVAAESGAKQSADALAAVTAQLAEASDERERLRVEASELRTLMDRQASEWRIERAALAAEVDKAVEVRVQLTQALSDLGEELDRLRADLAEARGHAARTEKHAAWAGEQIAALVETEAAKITEIGRKEAELEVLNIRLEGFRAELRAKEAELNSHDELQSRFRVRAMRILDADLRPAASALEVLDALHLRVRELERELDREATARQRMAASLDRLEASAYRVVLRACHSFLVTSGLRRLVPQEPRRFDAASRGGTRSRSSKMRRLRDAVGRVRDSFSISGRQ